MPMLSLKLMEHAALARVRVCINERPCEGQLEGTWPTCSRSFTGERATSDNLSLTSSEVNLGLLHPRTA